MQRGMRAALYAAAALALAGVPAHAQDSSASTDDQRALAAKYQKILYSLHPVSGDVSVPGADATLHLGDQFYFLNATDAKRVLTEAWGNPPDAVSDVLGLVFQKGTTFMDDTWGTVVTYKADGYVSDKDARTTDYYKLLQDMRSGEENENAERQKQKFDPIHLVGWAQTPSYDEQHHALVWARELKIGDHPEDTLNYDVRELGRRGVLSLNVIDKMSHLAVIRPAAQTLASVASFNSGARYEDYKTGVDKKAAYGVAGLIAAGAGVALAQKVGLIGLFLLFLKKGAIIFIAAFSGLAAWVRNLFKPKNAQ
jgi:uncharacterized membrane-anchored protein